MTTLAQFKKRWSKAAPVPAPSVKARAGNLPVLPAGTPLTLPPAIASALGQVREQQWRIHLAECVCLLLAALPLLWLLQGLADWWFNLPWLVRAVLLLADLGLVGFMAYRFGFQPWKKRLTLEGAALRVEREIPAFRTSLISTVELAAAKAGSTQGSLALVNELLARVDLQVRSMNLARIVVKTARLKLFARYAAGTLLVVGIVLFLTWPKPPVLLRRILLSTIPLPTRTVVIPITGDESVPIGSDLVLSTRAEGELPKSGRLLIVYADKTRQEITAGSTANATDVFAVTLRNIQQPFQYRFVLNDGTGPDFEVRAKVPPTLASLKIIQAYPEYSGIPASEMSAGNLALMAGSRIRIEGRASQSLKSATVQLEGASQQAEMKIADGKGIQGEFIVPKEGMTGFSLALLNEEGVSSVGNTVYRIELIPDKVPEIDLVYPSNPRLGILPRTRPRLGFSIRDDFGIKKVALKYELLRPVPPGGTEAPVEKGEISIPILNGKELPLNLSYTWDLSPLKPVEGGSITYWIEAADNNDVTGPGIGQSAKKTLLILSEEAKKAELLEMMGARASDIENIYNTQKKVNEDLDTTIRKTQP